VPPKGKEEGKVEPPAPPQPAPPAADLAALGETQGAATGGETGGLSAPNMIGDLLGGNRNVSYAIFKTDAFQGRAGTSIFNPKISENESPLPQDRIAYRYNFFHNASSVTGVTGGSAQVPPTDSLTRQFDVNLHTFQFEKTFLDARMSVELRVPFMTGVSPHLNITTSTQDGFQATTMRGEEGIGRRAINGRFTPQDTVGSESTEFGDLTLIFKGVLFCTDGFALTGGTTFGIPTAPDTSVNVTDNYFTRSNGVTTFGAQRFRDFLIRNDTWSMGPFLAFLSTPSDRFFAQGFTQVEFPLGSNKYRYFEDEGPKDPVNDRPLTVNGVPTPFVQEGHIRDQTLLNIDLGTGYWLVKNSCPDRWLNGLAAMLELHYTTTLNGADIVTLPQDNVQETSGGVRHVPPNPVIGNQRNRIDVLNLTAGVTAQIAERLMVTTAAVVPLLQGDNKLFDWEFQLQLNWQFGPTRFRAPPMAGP
jgi:hypothetical protein